jgi:hypothetical protein
MNQLLSSIHWVSFGLGFATAAVLVWAILTIWAWLKKVFGPPPGDEPFGQRLVAAARNLLMGVLILAALAVIGYIAYTVLLKP